MRVLKRVPDSGSCYSDAVGPRDIVVYLHTGTWWTLRTQGEYFLWRRLSDVLGIRESAISTNHKIYGSKVDAIHYAIDSGMEVHVFPCGDVVSLMKFMDQEQ